MAASASAGTTRMGMDLETDFTAGSLPRWMIHVKLIENMV
jgi:hypothetical protein